MRPLILLALAASLSLVGCLEEERTLTLEPDGRGTLRLVRTLGKESSGMILRLDMDRASAARRFAAEQLAEIQGVVAWTDVVAEVTSDDRLHVAATGWFEDVTALGHATPMAEQKPFVVVEREGSTWRVSLSPINRDPEALEGADLDEVLESLRKLASGLRHETVVVVPGDVVDASGWRRDGRALRCVLDEAGVLAATEGLPAGREGLEELVRRLDALVRAEATVTVPAATPSDGFTQRLRAAVTAWEGSPWREAVERERAKALEGRGGPQDAAAAVPWLRRAAELGVVPAMSALGKCLTQGQGCDRDDLEAARWFRTAAAHDDPLAQLGLGILLADGEAVARDEAAARRLFARAAEQDVVNAMYCLGTFLARGRGGDKDEPGAARWFRAAAERGHAQAMHELGVLLAEGRGAPSDEVEARSWLRRAADAGVLAAMHDLAVALVSGRGGPKDTASGADLLRQAAERGYPASMNALGLMLRKGVGVEQDLDEAAAWFRRAAAGSDPAVRADAERALRELQR